MNMAKFLGKQIKRVAVLLIGLPVIALGIILIPLPGPGLIVSFIGLFILSLGFEWPKVYLDKIKREFGKLILKFRQKMAEIDEKYK